MVIFWLKGDAMATEKLADGIRKFAADIEKLETIIDQRLSPYLHWFYFFITL